MKSALRKKMFTSLLIVSSILITFATIAAWTIEPCSSQSDPLSTNPLSKILIARIGPAYWDSTRYAQMGLNLAYELEIYQRWGVKWVTFYGIPTRAQTDLVHQYGLKALVYVNALAIEYTELRTLGYDDDTIREWAQKNRNGGYYYINTPTSKNATDDGYNSVRISPFAGYQGKGVQSDAFFELVLAPRLRKIVDPAQINADGVFTDVLFLKKKGTDTWGADANPHFITRYREWLAAEGKTDTTTNFKDFRYFSIHHYASRMNETIKMANPSAIVVISNNNVFTRSQRDAIALDISRLQDVSDVLLHEWADVDQVDPTSVINWAYWEKNGDPKNNAGLYHVTKPLWTHYLTYQASRFQTVVNAMNTYDFGYWGYNRYLWDNIKSLNINVYDKESGSPISGATVNVAGYGSKKTDSSGNVRFYLFSGTYSISITHTLYYSWSGSVTISQNTQLNRYLTPRIPGLWINKTFTADIQGSSCNRHNLLGSSDKALFWGLRFAYVYDAGTRKWYGKGTSADIKGGWVTAYGGPALIFGDTFAYAYDEAIRRWVGTPTPGTIRFHGGREWGLPLVAGDHFVCVYDTGDHTWHRKGTTGTLERGDASTGLAYAIGSRFGYVYDKSNRNWYSFTTPSLIKGVNASSGTFLAYGLRFARVYSQDTHTWYTKSTTLDVTFGQAGNQMAMVAGARFAYVWDRIDHGWRGKTTTTDITAAAASSDLAMIVAQREAYVYDRPIHSWVGRGTSADITEKALGTGVAVICAGSAAYAYDRSVHRWIGKGTPGAVSMLRCGVDLALIAGGSWAYAYDTYDHKWHGKGTPAVVAGLDDGYPSGMGIIYGSTYAYAYDTSDHKWHGKGSSGTIINGFSVHQLGLAYGSNFAYVYDRATRRWIGKGTSTPITSTDVSRSNGDLAYIYGSNYVYVTVSSARWYGKGTSEAIKGSIAEDHICLVVCTNLAYVFDTVDRAYHGKGLTDITGFGATPTLAYIHSLRTVHVYQT